MRATPILPASQAEVNSQQANSVSPCINPASTNNHSSSQPPTMIVREVYVPCVPTHTVASVAALDDLNGIAVVLTAHWEHLLPHQAAQLVERAVEKCKPFVPGELRSTLDTICDMAAYIRVQRSGRVAGLSGPCSSCGYYECSYCGNCHNPSCTAYTPTCSRSVEVRA